MNGEGGDRLLTPSGPRELWCTGKDEVTRRFWYDVQAGESEGEVCVRVHLHDPPQVEDHWFDLVLKKLGDRRYRSDSIWANQPHYSKQGIPDALYPELCRRFDIEIWSSQTRSCEAQYRTEDAEKMWKRLVTKGLATYVAESNLYVCPPTAS